MIAKFVRYAPTVLLAVFCIVIFGAMSYTSLPRESSPDVKIPVVMVSTPYIGVSPADIETLVTIPMENELSGVKDVKKLSSTSGEGISVVSMEFEPDVVIEDALQRVRDRVNRVKVTLPADAEEPLVQEISFSDFPILIVTLAGEVDQDVLKGYGEEMEDLVKRVPGVLDATLSGGRTRQIRVQFDPQRLANYGFSHSDIIQAIRDENVNIPGGDVAAGDTSFLVRVPGEFDSVEQIENVAVKRKEGAPIFIRDLARVVDSYADAETYARMNGQQAVSLAVTKRTGANIIDIADAIKLIAVEQSETWDEGVEYRLLADQSTQIRNMVSDLQNNILTSLILVIGVVLFFMGARNSLFVGIAIPLSMLMSFIVVQVLGMTLNMIVLFSFILALGMLVDNAIVVVENIYRHMEEGKSLKDASIDGTSEVAVAVAASTATTVAAFLPLVFWEGLMGQFMGFLPKTVIIVLVSSLVVAVVILPVATSRLMKRTKSEAAPVSEAPGPLMQRYRSLLVLSIRHRYISTGLGVATLIFSFMAYGALNHGTEFFPDTEPNRATISVRTPDGTDLETTDRIVRQIESVLATQENVDVTIAETGIGGGGSPMGGAQGNSNQARMTVDFLPDGNSAKPGETPRIENTRDTIDRLRETLAQIPGAEIKVEKESMGPPVGKPISVEVSGPDFHSVGELAAKVRREIRNIEGAADIQDDYRVGRPELRLQIDRGAAKRVGSSTSGVANAVRTAVSGTTASTLRDGKDEYDIVVEVDPRYRADAQAILNLRIPGREDTRPDTFSVPLSSVASYEMVGGSGGIRHIDQELVVTIEGDIAEGYNENAVRTDVIATIDRLKGEGLVPAGYDLRLGGANDEQRDAQEFLGQAFLIAIALIAVVLVTQFNSFTTPMVILASVVLSLVGVLWGLIITGTP
ncbi:MAG: multidrug efflux pump, partial [Myxococcota bacterium]